MLSVHPPGETAIRTRRTAALAAAVVLGALSLPTPASAATTDLYVDNTVPCTDTGHGTQAQPYCTVSAAAAAVLPGQTVHIAAGNYPETVRITRSGTAAAPITFTGAGAAIYYDAPSGYGGQPGPARTRYTWIGMQPNQRGGHALVIAGASHLRIQDMLLHSTTGAAVIDGGSDITLAHTQIPFGSATGAGFEIGGAAQQVTIRQSEGAGSPAVHLAPGVRGTVLATNHLMSAGTQPLMVADSAPGTVVVGNTLEQTCKDVISLAGASTGATVENNVVWGLSRPGDCPALPQLAQLGVAAEATEGTKVAYNAFDRNGSPAYRWAGRTYDTVTAFAAASGQGDHDIVGDTGIRPWSGDPGDSVSPVVDSADEHAPGMTDRDLKGDAPVRDPYASGTSRRDRGAYEIDNFAARYTPVGPVRLLDTRTSGVAIAPGGTVDLPIDGPAGLTAVTMNVTVTQSTAPGFLTVYPHGTDRPTASNLNWTAGQTVPNLVTTQVTDGKVSFYNGSSGTVHVIADLLGRYTRTGSGYHTVTPTRLLDTRTANQPLTPGKPLDLAIAGPADLTAVTLNLTATSPTDHGYLTAYPHGTEQPTASNLNWTAGQTIANLVTVPVKDGRITLVTGGTSGTVDLIADLAGYFTASGGDRYHALAPLRAVDTRTDPWIPTTGQQSSYHPGPIAPHRAPFFSTRVLDHTAEAVAMNVTVTGTTAPGYLTVYPYGSTRPLASNLNWTAGQTVPNQVVVGVGGTEDDYVYNGSSSFAQVIADVNGYYAP